MSPDMIAARQRRAADVTCVGAGGSPSRTCAATPISRTITGSSHGVVMMMVSLLMQTFCGCSGGQFDGSYKVTSNTVTSCIVG